MKIISSNGQLILIECSNEEMTFISQALNVPLHAFGKKEFLAKTSFSEEEIKVIYEKIIFLSKSTESKIEAKFKVHEIVVLENVFKAACDVIDPYEMHTLTGYGWNDALRLQKNLKEIVYDLHIP